jgi:hypothetical protein
MRAVTVTELSKPVEAPRASLMAELAERSGVSLLEAHRAVRALRDSPAFVAPCPRTRAFVAEVARLGRAERAALLASVPPFAAAAFELVTRGPDVEA